jgi:hypothetical protein
MAQALHSAASFGKHEGWGARLGLQISQWHQGHGKAADMLFSTLYVHISANIPVHASQFQPGSTNPNDANHQAVKPGQVGLQVWHLGGSSRGLPVIPGGQLAGCLARVTSHRQNPNALLSDSSCFLHVHVKPFQHFAALQNNFALKTDGSHC